MRHYNIKETDIKALEALFLRIPAQLHLNLVVGLVTRVKGAIIH